MEDITIKIPLKNEYLTTVRLTIGGVCSLAEFDVEQAEDLKVCVTESLLILKRNGFTKGTVTVSLGDLLYCKVRGEERIEKAQSGAEEDISYALLDALVGGAHYEKEDGIVCEIRFEA